MARRIEQVDGRLKLLKTIEIGPQAFLEVFVAVLATLAAARLIASVVPARRAASVDPLIALRQE